MKLAILTPVGPGHEKLAEVCEQSVFEAWSQGRGPFQEIEHRTKDDTEGRLGRSVARNLLIQEADADWLMYLDADDILDPLALLRCGRYVTGAYDAVWGQIWHMPVAWQARQDDIPWLLSGAHRLGGEIDDRPDHNEIDFRRFCQSGPYGTVSMGHFVRAEIAKRTPFLTYLNQGEDYENHLTLITRHRCLKAMERFVIIRPWSSSVGPRRATGDWTSACRKILDYWWRRGPQPMTDAERGQPHYWMRPSFRLSGGVPS